jgi:hypothetical protein
MQHLPKLWKKSNYSWCSLLQYGTQFGGLVNFKLKSPTEKPFELTTRNTLGSYGLYTNFTSISGTNKSLVITVSIITKGNGLDPILILSKYFLILITSSMTKHRYTLIIPILPI